MPTINEHVPGFVKRDTEPREATFETRNDLHRVPFVGLWMEMDDFDRFQIESIEPYNDIVQPLLVAYFKDGRKYIVGHISGDLTNVVRWSQVELRTPNGEDVNE